ncbi:Cys-Gln thioester bond-forming surface protein [Enterococcus faecium]|uniref:thioester domain-containing protein n=1 Tax=Enterococcus faecium TaxID=1352 RepID=UPI00156102F8|nr:thioester domain-containing protein [Enterococcus faecium]NRE65547.1 Cys-Gln thioester bond-forming surface protein [Enterococcus faecium]NTQ95202.1 Cys-Gln thioester bond-forming surface protein [Enterococcus faecium]HCC6682895.1 Cys-Gln thioester bond-forming surface protein [Enterococcus faecium]
MKIGKKFLTITALAFGLVSFMGNKNQVNAEEVEKVNQAPNSMQYHMIGGDINGYMRVKLADGSLNYMVTHEFVNEQGEEAYCLNSELPSPNGDELTLVGQKGDEFVRAYKAGYNQSGDLNNLPVANTQEARYATQAVMWALADNYKVSDMVWSTPERTQEEIDRVHKAFNIIYDAAVNGKETTDTTYQLELTKQFDKNGYHNFEFKTTANHEGKASISFDKEVAGMRLVDSKGKEVSKDNIPLNETFYVQIPDNSATDELQISSIGYLSTVHAFEYGGNASVQNVMSLVNVEDEHKVDNLKINWTLAKGKIKVHKIDEQGKALQGAEFTLTDKNGKQTKQVTDKTGFVQFDIQAGNVYQLEETKNPTGYNGSFLQKDITVKENGQVFDYTAKNAQNKGQIIVHKKDENGKAVIGAEFTLTDKDGKKLVKTTDSQGNITFNITSNNTYALKETKVPTGYEGSFEKTGITLKDNNQIFEYTAINKHVAKQIVQTGSENYHQKALIGVASAMITVIASVAIYAKKRKKSE